MAILRSGGRVWRDHVVVVTGGTSGIGREFAVRLAAEGAKVIVCARNEVALRELHARDPQIEAIRCDVTVPTDVLALEAAGPLRQRRCLDKQCWDHNRSIYWVGQCVVGHELDVAWHEIQVEPQNSGHPPTLRAY